MIIRINKKSYLPVFEQIKLQVKMQVVRKLLLPLDTLPSIRELASDLLINPNTVARAYRELESEGLIVTEKGRGCFVSAEARQKGKRSIPERVLGLFDEAVSEARKKNLSDDELREILEHRLNSGQK